MKNLKINNLTFEELVLTNGGFGYLTIIKLKKDFYPENDIEIVTTSPVNGGPVMM